MHSTFLIALAMLLLMAEACFGQPRHPPPRGGRMGPPPPNGMMERLSSMTPEQRQQALDRLPADRREKVKRRLENFEALPPEEKKRLREQYQEFQKLPPERQDEIRRSFRQFSELPEDRRRPVRHELMRLRQLSPEERSARVESETFRSQFSESERQLLQDLAKSPGPGRNN